MSLARLMARSTLSLGMFKDFAFWMTARNLEFESGSGPAFFDRHYNVFTNSGKGLTHGRPTFHFSCFSEFKSSSHNSCFLLKAKYKKYTPQKPTVYSKVSFQKFIVLYLLFGFVVTYHFLQKI